MQGGQMQRVKSRLTHHQQEADSLRISPQPSSTVSLSRRQARLPPGPSCADAAAGATAGQGRRDSGQARYSREGERCAHRPERIECGRTTPDRTKHQNGRYEQAIRRTLRGLSHDLSQIHGLICSAPPVQVAVTMLMQLHVQHRARGATARGAGLMPARAA